MRGLAAHSFCGHLAWFGFARITRGLIFFVFQVSVAPRRTRAAFDSRTQRLALAYLCGLPRTRARAPRCASSCLTAAPARLGPPRYQDAFLLAPWFCLACAPGRGSLRATYRTCRTLGADGSPHLPHYCHLSAPGSLKTSHTHTVCIACRLCLLDIACACGSSHAHRFGRLRTRTHLGCRGLGLTPRISRIRRTGGYSTKRAMDICCIARLLSAGPRLDCAHYRDTSGHGLMLHRDTLATARGL